MRRFITAEEAIALLPEGDEIHIFYQMGGALVGADWDRADILQKLTECDKIEIASEVSMKDWKEIAKKDTRYEDFVISEDPKSFKEMFADQDIPYVQIHSTQVVGAEDQEYLVGFCGVFEWKENKIIPLDGDSYSEDMKVLGYEWFEHEGNKSLDILVGEDW